MQSLKFITDGNSVKTTNLPVKQIQITQSETLNFTMNTAERFLSELILKETLDDPDLTECQLLKAVKSAVMWHPLFNNTDSPISVEVIAKDDVIEIR